MPPLRGLIFLGFGSTKIPLLTELKRMNPRTQTCRVLAKYAAHVTSASFGAVTDMDLKL